MPRHHYIPISVLRTFASRDAWKVLEAPTEIKQRIASSDRNCIEHGQTRNWPVVVYDKREKRFTRSTIGHTCSAPQLYKVPDYDDQLIRAIVRLNLREDIYEELRGFNFEALMRLGVEPLDPEWIERTAIGNLDTDFGTLLPLLKGATPISTEQVAIVLRFVAFARFRIPLWRSRYFPERLTNLVWSLREQIDHISHVIEDDLPEEFRESLVRFNRDMDEHVYHMAMMRYASDGFDALSTMVKPKIRILHTVQSAPFVTCDNPARPYKPTHLRKIFDRGLPGMADPRVHMLYPISPLACIVISSNNAWRDFIHQDANVSSVRAINTALAIMADEQIIFAGPNTSVFENWLKLDLLRPLLRP
jgi:hypothetical protein